MSWLISVQNINILAGRWISPGTPVFSTNKTDCQDKTDILLKVALNTISPIPLYKTIQGNNCHINYLIFNKKSIFFVDEQVSKIEGKRECIYKSKTAN
jgi:hypothetical protein